MAKKVQRTRRANGEGLLRQRENGSWELRVQDGVDEKGRPRRKSFYGRDPQEVYAKMAEYLEAKASGVSLDSEYTFDEWADIWFDSHKDSVSPTTCDNYQYTMRILKRFFGNRKLQSIKAMDVEQMLKKLQREGRSSSGLAQCRGMLYQIMNKAEANDLIAKNPVRYAEKMRHTGPVREKAAFTSEEVARLMQELPYSKIGVSIRLMLGTGMRTQELIALESRHISEDGSMIQVCQAVNMVKGTVTVGQPKSRDSYRTIPVPANLRWCATKLREGGRQFIWESPRNPGQPVNPSYFREQFRKALEAVPEVRRLTPHCCRHTYVSQMQALGVDIATIQSIVGHADVDMTRHYLHVQDEVKARAIGLFSDAFPVPLIDSD